MLVLGFFSFSFTELFMTVRMTLSTLSREMTRAVFNSCIRVSHKFFFFDFFRYHFSREPFKMTTLFDLHLIQVPLMKIKLHQKYKW